jgi:hypothetical protein
MVLCPVMAVIKMNTNKILKIPARKNKCDEARVYEDILATYQRVGVSEADRLTAGSRLAVKLAAMEKEKGKVCAGTTRNDLLLLLALFFLRDNQLGLPGQDIAALASRERDRLLADLAGALPGA